MLPILETLSTIISFWSTRFVGTFSIKIAHIRHA